MDSNWHDHHQLPPSVSACVPRVLWNVLFSLECAHSSPMALHLLKQLFPQVQCRLCCCCSVTKSCVTFATPWTAACQASLSFTISQSLPKVKSIESMMSSNRLILCHPLLLPSIFPSIRVFPNSQFLASCGQTIAASASASVLPMNIQDWFPLRWTGLISLQSKGLSKVFSYTTVQKHEFFSTQLSLWSSFHTCTWLLEKA